MPVCRCCCFDLVGFGPIRIEPPNSSRLPWTFGAFPAGYSGGNGHSTAMDHKNEASYIILRNSALGITALWKGDFKTRQKSEMMARAGAV